MPTSSGRRASVSRPDVHVPRHAGMLMHDAAVRVRRRRPVRALARRAHDRAQAEHDQHDRDAELEEIGDARRHLRPQPDQRDPDDDQRERVAEAPAEARAMRRGAIRGGR